MELSLEDLLWDYFGMDELKNACDEIGVQVSGTKDQRIKRIMENWEKRNRNSYQLLDFIDEEYLAMICKDFNLNEEGDEHVLKRRIKKAELLGPIQNKKTKKTQIEKAITDGTLTIEHNKTKEVKSEHSSHKKRNITIILSVIVASTAFLASITTVIDFVDGHFVSTKEKIPTKSEIISSPIGEESILDSINLQQLPSPAITPGLGPSNEVFLIDVNNQKFVASPFQKLTLKIKLQYSTSENPDQVTQAFLLPSWSQSWPPDEEHYFPLVNGIPSLAPGNEREFTVIFTAPDKEGTYYLWLAMGSFYSMEDAVNSFKNKPHMPAHIKFIVKEI